MTPERTTHPLDDLAVYALDALDHGGRALVDAHLVDCAACRTELGQHRTTLSRLTTPEAPPPDLWDRIARQTTIDATQAADVMPFDLHRDAGRPAVTGPDHTSPDHAGPDDTGTDHTRPDVGHTDVIGADVGHPDVTGPAVGRDATGHEFAGHDVGRPEVAGPGPDAGPRHRVGRLPPPDGRAHPGRPGAEPRHRAAPHTFDRSTWLVAVAAAMVIVVGVAVWSLRSQETAPTVAELATTAADDPDATVVALASDTGDARARVVTTPQATAYVLLDDLPRLRPGRTYQLWKFDGGSAPVSLGILGDGSEQAAAVSVPRGTTSFALSDEPAAGSVTPTAIVATGRT